MLLFLIFFYTYEHLKVHAQLSFKRKSLITSGPVFETPLGGLRTQGSTYQSSKYYPVQFNTLVGMATKTVCETVCIPQCI